jgi:hypothetical protein
MINTKVVKNLAISFCKVSEETVDKNILKKHKASDGDNKTMVPPGVIGQKKSSNTSSSSKIKPIEKKGKISLLPLNSWPRRRPPNSLQ